MAVTGSGDKHAKTSTFIINFLPMQLIDWDKTDRSLLPIQLIDGGKTDRSLLPIQLIDGLKQIEAYSRCNWLMGWNRSKLTPDATDWWAKTDRNLLSIQLIDGGKTDRNLLKVDFSKSFWLNANPKHCNSEKEAKDY